MKFNISGIKKSYIFLLHSGTIAKSLETIHNYNARLGLKKKKDINLVGENTRNWHDER